MIFQAGKRWSAACASMCLIVAATHGSYDPRALKVSLETQALGNVYLSLPGGKILMQGDLAKKFGWIMQRVGEQAGLKRDKPLFVPVPKPKLDEIRNCMNAIVEDPSYERLQFEVLSDLSLADFADLLIYSWFLQVSDLLLVAAPEFVERIKGDGLDSFAERANFLDTILTAQGKPEGVAWDTCIVELKKWLAHFVLSDENKNQLRSHLVHKIKLAGVPEYAACGLMGSYIAVSGEKQDEAQGRGFCDLVCEERGDVDHCFETVLPAIAGTFSVAPLMVIADCTSVFVADVITKVMKHFAVTEAIGQDAVFNCLAISPDLKSIALSIPEGVVLIDVARNSVKSLIAHDQKAAVFGGFLHFVSGRPLLLDIRTSADSHFVRIWHTQSGKMVLEKDFHGAPITAYCCTEDGKVWMMSSNGVLVCLDCTLTSAGELLHGGACDKRWDPREQEGAFTLWEKDARPLCFHPTGNRLVLGHNRGIATIIDTGGDCKQLARLASDETMVLKQACYGKDHLLATLGHEGKITLWNGENGQKLVSLMTPADRLFWFAPDNSYLLTSKGAEACLSYYSNKDISQYLDSEINLEQGLLLLWWLKLKKGQPLDSLLADLDWQDQYFIARTLDHKKMGRFVLADCFENE